MIPLDISNETTLRRTLEELENRIPVLEATASTIVKLGDAPDATQLALKVNEIIGTINLIVSSLNRN